MHINPVGYFMSSDGEDADATFLTGLELDTSDCESQHDVNVGPIRLNGSVYCHQGHEYAVDVQDQPEKVINTHLEPQFYKLHGLLPVFHVLHDDAGAKLPNMAIFAYTPSLPRLSPAKYLAGVYKSGIITQAAHHSGGSSDMQGHSLVMWSRGSILLS